MGSAQKYLQLPLRQCGAGNVYLLVLSSWKLNIAENPIAPFEQYDNLFIFKDIFYYMCLYLFTEVLHLLHLKWCERNEVIFSMKRRVSLWKMGKNGMTSGQKGGIQKMCRSYFFLQRVVQLLPYFLKWCPLLNSFLASCNYFPRLESSTLDKHRDQTHFFLNYAKTY